VAIFAALFFGTAFTRSMILSIALPHLPLQHEQERTHTAGKTKEIFFMCGA
jgi:hypothetical protein